MNKIIALFLVVCSNCFSMQQSDFRNDHIILSDHQVTLTLQNHPCEVANFYIGNSAFMPVPQTPLVHSYHGYESFVTFSANIHDKNLLAGMVRILGINTSTAQYCSLTVMNDDSGICAYKPQHAFSGAYKGSDTWAMVAAKCKVYTASDAQPNDFSWEAKRVSFHPDIHGATLISEDTHHLNFSQDGKTRIVLHHSQYLQGQLAGQSRIGMIVLSGNDAAGQGILRALKKNNSFADAWSVIEQYWPEFSADLQLPERIQQDMQTYAPYVMASEHYHQASQSCAGVSMTQLPLNQIDYNSDPIVSQLKQIDEKHRGMPQYALLHDVIESLIAYSRGRTEHLANDFTKKLSALRASNCFTADVINAIIQARFECK